MHSHVQRHTNARTADHITNAVIASIHANGEVSDMRIVFQKNEDRVKWQALYRCEYIEDDVLREKYEGKNKR